MKIELRKIGGKKADKEKSTTQTKHKNQYPGPGHTAISLLPELESRRQHSQGASHCLS